MGQFEILPHTADVLVKAWGTSLEDALEGAIRAFYEIMTDTSTVEPVYREIVEAEGFDLESLLYNLIEALIVKFDEKAFLAAKVEKITVADKVEAKHVEAILLGESFNPDKHESRVLIKAATYHLMKIWTENGKWYLQYVVDI
ncbi:MAG: archease [Infirmifilum sp.]